MPDAQKPSCASGPVESCTPGGTAPASDVGSIAHHLSLPQGFSSPSAAHPASHVNRQPFPVQPLIPYYIRVEQAQDGQTNPRRMFPHTGSVFMGAPFRGGPPPPPPPLPLPPFPPPPPPDPLPRSHFKRYRPKDLDVIEYQHESLLDSREALLGTRFQLQGIRREVRALREETGTKEGYYIDQLRGFLHENGIDLPQSIAAAWQDVLASRDALGLSEGRYDDIEEQYHFQEMKYTENEGKFVDELLSSDPPSQPAAHADPFTFPSNNDMNFALGSSAPTQGLSPDASIQQSESQDHRRLTLDNSSLTPTRAPTNQSEQSVPRLTKQYLESRLPPVLLGQAEITKQVNEWMLEILAQSDFQKAQLRAYNPSNDMPSEIWWQLVKDNWHPESSTVTYRYTGDSTFSQAAGSQLPSAVDFDTFGMEGIDLEAPYPPALMPDNQILRALQDPSVAPSTYIQSVDLGDADNTDNIPSTSSDYRRIEDTYGNESAEPPTTQMTLIDDSHSCNTTTEVVHAPFRSYTPKLPSEDSKVPVQPPQSKPDSPWPVTVLSDSHTPDWPTELVEYRGVDSTRVRDLNDQAQHWKLQEEPLPPRSGSEPPKAPHALIAFFKGLGHHPTCLPSQTSKPKLPPQLPFPILPLTPISVTTDPTQTSKLDLPFVALNGFSIRLPGPTSDVYD